MIAQQTRTQTRCIRMITSPMDEMETVYFNMFPTSRIGEEEKRMLLFGCYTHISRTRRTTFNKLKYSLNNAYSFTEADIRIALHALNHTAMFNCVSTYNVPASAKRRAHEVIHLKDNPDFESWYGNMVTTQKHLSVGVK